ncbi:MAG: DUF6279 family lipoprotein [Gammaproteobacteria bacterium]|nr:DUF6279 family lipoprotein [Gammaproteobacteria bacterium]
MILAKSSLTRQTKILLIATIVALTSACSFKSLYNRLDYLIPVYLEGMVSFDDVLEKKVEQRAQLLISWHRNTQLKEYASWLRSLQQDITKDLTDKKLSQHITKLENFWESVSQKLNDEMVGLLPLLNSEQRKELFASITKKNNNFSDEYIDLEEKKRIDSYIENMFDSYESWLGDLTEEQEKAIEQAASKLHSVAHLRLKQRLLWQQGIQKILDKNEPASLKSERLRTFFVGFETNNNSEMERLATLNRHTIEKLTLKIINTLSTEQKEHFMSETSDYIRMFTELSENR